MPRMTQEQIDAFVSMNNAMPTQEQIEKGMNWENTLDPSTYQALNEGGFEEKALNKLAYAYQNSAERTRMVDSPYGKIPVKGGYGAFGYDYIEALINDPAYREQFKKKPGQTVEQWIANLEKHFPGIKTTFENTMKGDVQFRQYFDYTTRGSEETGLTPEQQAEKDRIDAERKTRAEIAAFAESLKGDLDVNDPEVKDLMSIAQGQIQQMNRDRGVKGNLANANSEEYMQGHLNRMNADREARYFQALQYKNADQLGEGQRVEAGRMSDWESQVGMARQREANSPNGWVGGAIGGTAGAVGGFFAGGPAGAVAGAGAGWQLGRSVGQATASQGVPPPPTRRYSGSY